MPDLKNVYWLQELGKDSAALAGGKAANLGELLNAGFPVPPGFAISLQAYRSFVYANALDKLVKESTDNLDASNPAELQKASDAIRTAFVNSPTPAEVRADVVRAYNKLCGDAIIPALADEAFVAVRSSPLEETRETPAAETAFLNVRGSEELMLAVKKCWASLFHSDAIRLRKQNNSEQLTPGFCVLVQKMVESQVSGTLFTVDPISQDTALLAIEAGFGLGETAEGAAVARDKYVVERNGRAVLKRQVERQEEMVALIAGENKRITVPEELQEARKLTDTQAIELAEMGKGVEAHFEAPQQVEWAIEDDAAFILRTRPITTLSRQKLDEVALQKREAEVEERLRQIPAVESFSLSGEPAKKDFEEEQKEEWGEKREQAVALAEKILEEKPGRKTAGAEIILEPFSIEADPVRQKASGEGEPHLFTDFFEKMKAGGPEKQQLVREEKNVSEAEPAPAQEKQSLFEISHLQPGESEAKEEQREQTRAPPHAEKSLEEAVAAEAARHYSGFSQEPTATQIICFNSFEEGCDGSMAIDSLEDAEKACEHARPLTALLAFSGNAGKVREKIVETTRAALPSNLKAGALLSTPGQALSAGEYCSAGAKFVALDLKSLHKLALGPEAEEAGDAHPSVMKLVQTVARECGKRGVETFVLAEWRVSQELAQKLVEAGVEGVCVAREDLPHAKRLVSSAERKLLLKKARS